MHTLSSVVVVRRCRYHRRLVPLRTLRNTRTALLTNNHFFDRYNRFYSNCSCRKDAKKVSKLESQIPYHEARGAKDEVQKIKDQVEKIWTKTREAHEASFQ